MTSPRCQQDNPDGQKFCAQCGTPVGPSEGTLPGVSYAEVQQDLREAREQQTATAEILRVISRSPGDVQPVLDAVAESAARLCDSSDAEIFRRDGDRLLLVAHHGPIPSRTIAVPLGRGTFNGRTVLDGRTFHVADLQSEADEFPRGSELARQHGTRAQLSVPLMREGVAIGTISLRRTEARLFTERQIALLQTFADQAVIAIENVRLFTELQEKNRALTEAHAQVTESLEQQTATSEILRVISHSPTDIQPVFDTIVRNAVRLCDARFALVYRLEGDRVHLVAHHNFSPAALEQFRRTFSHRLSEGGTVVGQAMLQGAVVHVEDLERFPEVNTAGLELARSTGYRSVVALPIMREGVALGAIAVTRGDTSGGPRPFSEREIELLKTFTEQAVIAVENVRLFKELETANRDLAAASQHKSEFLANMSHELRTPLNAIIGYSELLEEEAGDLDGGRLVPDLQKIATAAKHQLSLINDILDLSKVEAGRMELELADFDLSSAIDNALTLVRERATRRGITLGRTIDDRVGVIRGDERKVKQVFLNLLSNALKFTPEGGRIDVGATVNEGLVEVSVTDTGVGIAPEDQEAVFEEFRQVGTADKKVEGTGLGLALSRRFIELHGGRIWVKSEPGHGSTFTFTIPERREPAPEKGPLH